MDSNKTILYITYGGIDPFIRDVCLSHLYKAAGDIPIIERHQPADWPRSGLSMYRNILAGLEQVKTKYVAVAEHDCIYSHEHFSFTPPDDFFYYNQNSWFLQYRNPNWPQYDGMFTYWPKRRVQSQLICTTEKLKEVTDFQIQVVESPLWNEVRGNMPIGEPGTIGAKALKLTKRERYSSLHQLIKDYLVGYEARDFFTQIPNIDIRWGGNLTGPRRGHKKRLILEPWGSMGDVMVK
jgi:hypothetical protein